MNEAGAVAVGDPFVWRLSLASTPERVFELLDTDAGRERFWALHSRATPGGFDLEFPGGLEGRVDVLHATIRTPGFSSIRAG